MKDEARPDVGVALCDLQWFDTAHSVTGKIVGKPVPLNCIGAIA